MLVGNYLLQKTDTQPINQAQLIFNSMDSLSSDTGDDGRAASMVRRITWRCATANTKHGCRIGAHAP